MAAEAQFLSEAVHEERQLYCWCVSCFKSTTNQKLLGKLVGDVRAQMAAELELSR